jgi:hypothetical protein
MSKQSWVRAQGRAGMRREVTKKANEEHLLSMEQDQAEEHQQIYQHLCLLDANEQELFDNITSVRAFIGHQNATPPDFIFQGYDLFQATSLYNDDGTLAYSLWNIDGTLDYPFKFFGCPANCASLLWSWITRDISVLEEAVLYAEGWTAEGPTWHWMRRWIDGELTPREDKGFVRQPLQTSYPPTPYPKKQKKTVGFTLENEVKEFEVEEPELEDDSSSQDQDCNED